MRTVVEFNHDLAHAIKDDPGGFAGDLFSYLNSGSREAADRLRKYGIKTLCMVHHSDDVRISVSFNKIT
jgi:hypothetical protein